MQVSYARYGHDRKRERVQRVPFFFMFWLPSGLSQTLVRLPGNLRHVKTIGSSCMDRVGAAGYGQRLHVQAQAECINSVCGSCCSDRQLGIRSPRTAKQGLPRSAGQKPSFLEISGAALQT
jgi:hypothetical protein